MKMRKRDFLALMEFPPEWTEWRMYPADARFLRGQLKSYEPGAERASEHFRNGAFHWWLRRRPAQQQVRKLILLTVLDPDPILAKDVRRRLSRFSATPELKRLLKTLA